MVKEVIDVDRAFVFACMNASVSVAKRHIANGVDVRTNSEDAVFRAISGDNLSVLKYLHKEGCVSHIDNGVALRLACSLNSLLAIKYLYPLVVNITDIAKALHAAAEAGSKAAIHYLLHVINVNEIDLIKIRHVASRNNHDDIVRLICNKMNYSLFI